MNDKYNKVLVVHKIGILDFFEMIFSNHIHKWPSYYSKISLLDIYE